MNLREALRLDAAPRLAFVGAGGKTTALFQLARQFEGPVFVTSTTHLGVGQTGLADRHFTFADAGAESALETPPSGVTLFTGPGAGSDRIAGVGESPLARIRASAERHRLPLLIEADGSRTRPVKAPAAHEPALPDFVKTVVVTAGLGALGRPAEAPWVHRPERFAPLAGLAPGATITPRSLARTLAHEAGGLKGIRAGARRVVLLNQADTEKLRAQGRGMAEDLLGAYQAVIVAALARESIFAVHERVAGVILAAGEASRMGRLKQVLEWEGPPLVRHAAETALAAGLSPVVVVVGAQAARVAAAVAGLPVRVVEATDWASGQAASVKRGLFEVSTQAGAVVFLLADQPQIPGTLVRSLREAHAQTLSSIVAPLVDGQRGNPVLFDQRTFTDFEMLEGDKGGRALFSRYRVNWVPWHDDRPLADVDTEADYAHLLEDGGWE